MVILKTESGSTAGPKKKFTSATFNHPQLSAGQYIDYNLTHNFGEVPDEVILWFKEGTGWMRMPMWSQEGVWHYYWYMANSSTINNAVARILYPGGGDHDCYGVCYKF